MSLKRHAFRNKLVEMLEDMKSLFASKRPDTQGNPARFLTIKDVEILEYTALDTKTEVLAQIDFQSDNGDWKQEILIRQFALMEDYTQELNLHEQIVDRCSRFDLVEAALVIHRDDRSMRIMYDLDEAITFFAFRQQTSYIHDLIGKAVAILQGVDSYGLDHTNLRELCEFIIQQIPLSPDDKEMVRMLLEPHFPIIDYTPGGYVPTTLFDPSFVRIKITKMNSYIVYIIPHEPLEPVVDRMTDVAAIYAESSYVEFCAFGHVDTTRQLIARFFKGYNELSGFVHGTPLEKLYPHGITLDLQMFINFFLLEMTKLSEGIAFKDPITYQYMVFLLTKKPFLLIDLDQ